MKKARILIVDDDTDVLDGLQVSLNSEGFRTIQARNRKEALQAIEKDKPDMILLDIMLNDGSGMEIKKQLNRDRETAEVPVIFLTAKGGVENKINGLKTGAYDYIVKPVDVDELIARIEPILSRRKYYEDMAMTDGPTGLYNRHYFDRQLKIFHEMARRYKRPYSIVVIDINDLKEINDTLGHAAGDFIIKTTAKRIKDMIRNMDVAVRYGGDEFVVILPETNNKQLRKFIKRAENNINGNKVIFDKKPISFSVSIGGTTCTSGEVSPDKIFKYADMNMYRVKTRYKKQKEKRAVLIIEDEKDIAEGVKLELEDQGFVVSDILNTFEGAVDYIRSSDVGKAPNFIVLDLNLDGYLSTDFLGDIYAKWKNTEVFVLTAYMGYLERYPFIRDIVTGVFDKSKLDDLIKTMNAHS